MPWGHDASAAADTTGLRPMPTAWVGYAVMVIIVIWAISGLCGLEIDPVIILCARETLADT